MYRRFRPQFLVLLSLATLASSLVVIAPEVARAQAFTPWECDGTPILMRGGQLHRIVPDPAVPGNLTIDTIAGTKSIWNSTGYDPITNWIYGVGSVGGVKQVRAYDATGAIVFQTAIQAPYPMDAGTYAGTVLGDGRYIIHSVGNGGGTKGWYAGARFNLWSIDPVTGASTHIGSTPVNLADFSYNPLDGYLYQIVNRQLYKIDPNTGATTSTPMPGAFPNGSFGASWFDAAGFLYSFRNNPGDIFKVDPADTSTWVEVGEVGSNGGTDAAACVSQIDLKKDVVDGAGEPVAPSDRVYAPGTTITYAFTLINNGLPTQNRTVDLCDVLPADGRTYTGTWTSTHPSAVVSSGGASGDTAFCIEVESPSSLWTDPANPGSDPVVVTVDVLLGSSMLAGDYENQATMDFDQDGTVDVFSDDPGDGSEPRDPTTITVTGSFTVDKTVVGHPVPNTTDSFVINVVCEAADGSALSLPGNSFRNAADGTAWPSASAGTFEISDGDEVLVRNLPAGATCTATEVANTSYVTATVSADGVDTASSGTITIDEPPADESVSFTNSTASFVISKSATVASALPVAADGSFDFEVVCDNGFSDTITLSTVGGSVLAGYPITPLVPEGATCTVTEQVPTGWNVTTANPATLVASSGSTPTASFSNERLFADLTISKEIIGLPSGADATSYSFDVSVTCIGGFDPNPYVVPGQLTIQTNAPIVIEDLPVGTACTVTEAPEPGFLARYAPDSTVTIDAAGSSVQITNSTGSLIVQKDTTVASSLPVDPRGSFSFQITCLDGAGATVYDNLIAMTASSLTATGATGGISHAEVGVLPPDSNCSITEQTPPTGWSLVSPVSGTANLTITEADPEPTANFVNSRDVGDLTVTKSLAGVPAGLDLSTEVFTVDISCVGDFVSSPFLLLDQPVTASTPLVVEGLPTGAVCVVAEDPDQRFSTSSAPVDGTVTIDGDGETVAITNTTTSFSLTKVTTATSAFVEDLDGTFDFAIVCVAPGGATVYNETVSITTVGATGSGLASVLPLVPAGSTCTVTEQDPGAGWTLTSRTGGTNVGADAIEFVTSATPGSLEFSNALDLASLTITKDVVGFAATAALEAEAFPISVVCTGNFPTGSYTVPGPLTVTEGSPLVISDLPLGAECTVSEAADSRFGVSFAPSNVVSIVAAGATIAIENATSTFSIDKTTSVPAGVDPDATFSFDIACVAADGATVYTDTVAIATSSGSGTWASPDAPFLAPGAVCTVVESPPANWAAVGASTVEITTTDASTVVASFTNERAVADLVISKALLGIPDGFNFDDEPFSVNVSCTGDFAVNPFVLTGLVVTSNAPLTVPNLPTGAVCDVDEDFDSRFQALYSPDIGDETAAQVTIAETGGNVGLTNAGGTLAVRKDTVGPITHPLDLLVDISYDIDCGAEYSGTHLLSVDQMAGDQGIGGITYTELPIMPLGTVCSISETVPTNWTVTTDNPQSVTISADPPTANFSNTRNTASLTVAKSIVGAPASVDLSDEEFIVDISCSGGFTVDPYLIADQTISVNTPLVIDDLPVGTTCSVVEDADPRFTTTIDPAVVLAEGGSTLTVTNTTSTIGITKATVGGSVHPIALDDTFTFDIDCTGYSIEPVSITTVGQAGTWAAPDTPLLAPGTECEIFESDVPGGWDVAAPNPVTVTTDGSGTAAVANFTNNRTLGDLTITKTITGSPVPLGDEEFTIEVVCNDGFTTPTYDLGTFVLTENTPVTIADLPTAATCTVTEQDDPRFLAGYDPDDGAAVITVDGVEIGVENRTGSFSLRKEVTVDGTQPIDVGGTFVIDMECTDGTTIAQTFDIVGGVAETKSYPAVPLLPDGTACTLSESTLPAGWTLVEDGDADVDAVANNTELIISSESNPTVTFVNHRETGDLSISKTVVGTPTGLDPAGLTFTVDVSCAGDFVTSPLEFLDQSIGDGDTITFENLPTGALCTVVEDTEPRFAATYTPAEGAGSEVTIDDDGENVAIVNSTGEIMIVKTTEVDSIHPVDVTGTFTFDVDCGAAHSGTYNIAATTVTSPTTATGFLRYDDLPALPNGTACTVSESTPPSGWTRDSAASVDLTVTSAGVSTATFANVRSTGSLSVSKVLVGVPAGVDLDGELFGVSVSCVGDFVSSPLVLTGEVSVDVPWVIDGLPTGSVCSVVEDGDARFVSSVSSAVTISGAGESLVVTNTTSTLFVSKVTSVVSGHPVDVDGVFSFDVVCGLLFSGVVDVTVSGGVGVWESPGTPLLPPGTECVVSEQVPSGWSLVDAGSVTVTTDESAAVEAAFANVRSTGSLSVSKVLVGVPAGVDLDTALFEVTVTCTGDFNTSSYETTGQVSVAEPWIIDNLPTDAVCTVVETPDSRFITSYDPDDGSGAAAQVTMSLAGESVEITNSTGEAIITKETIAPSTHPLDALGTFVFAVDCGATYSALHEVVVDVPTATGGFGMLRYTDIPLLPDGTQCSIAEVDPGTLWVLESPESVDITISSAAPTTAAFVNRRLTGSVEVVKMLDGVPADIDLSDEIFEVTLSCTGGFEAEQYSMVLAVSQNAPLLIDDLPTEAVCGIVETADERFSTTYSAEEVTIADEPQSVQITNSTQTFTITINTMVESTYPLEIDDTFEFVVTCTDPDGAVVHTETIQLTTVDGTATWTSPLVPGNATCVATQVLGDDWQLDDRDGGQNVGADAISVVSSDDTGRLVFENSRPLSTLRIEKELVDVPAALDYGDTEFPVTVTCEGGFTTSTFVIPGDLTVSSIEPLVISDLPTTTQCEIVETVDELFDATYSDDGQPVLSSGENVFTITNTGTAALDALAVDPPNLAFSGIELRILLLTAFAFLSAGVLLVASTKRRRTT